MDYTVNIELPDHKRGDRWIGIHRIGPVLIDGAAPPDALARVRCQFRLTRGRRLLGVFTIDSQDAPDRDAPAVILDAGNWTAEIPAIQEFLPVSGKWAWDIEFYDTANAEPLTLYKGVLTVHDDTTKKPDAD